MFNIAVYEERCVAEDAAAERGRKLVTFFPDVFGTAPLGYGIGYGFKTGYGVEIGDGFGSGYDGGDWGDGRGCGDSEDDGKDGYGYGYIGFPGRE